MSTTTVLVAFAVFALGVGIGAGAIWILLLLRRGKLSAAGQKTAPPPGDPDGLYFRWSYVAIPIFLLLFCLAVAAIVHPSLPESVAYRFSSAGVPTSFLPRAAFTAIMLGAQAFITLAVVGLAFGIVSFGRRMLGKSALAFNVHGMIWLMTNMLALPQIILAFILLDSSFYALQGSHIMAPWLFSLITVGLGSLVILFVFVQVFKQATRDPGA
jgi:uncharacterized membrane protein